MRKVIAGAFVSLDGVMQAPGGPGEDDDADFAYGGWVAPYWNDVIDAAMIETLSMPYDLLLGRRTYDIFARHWPRIKDDPVADQFNAVAKYVATRSNQDFSWANTVALRGDAAAEVAKLKQQDGPKLLIQGSSDFNQSLLAGGLIDELRLIIFPVMLGSGKRLFRDGAQARAFALKACQTAPNGVIIANYERNGEVRTGSFALPEDA